MEIYNKITSILSEIDAIGKNKKNAMQGYMFRGIDDMYNSIHPLFSKHKVFITSEVLSSKREERASAKGGVLIYTIALCKFTFWTTDGTSVSSTLEGEAMDSGDKSTNKAMSTALKYALMQMFLIPTEEKIDTEYESHQPAPKKKKLSDSQLATILERVSKGEKDLIEKTIEMFELTEVQKSKLI